MLDDMSEKKLKDTGNNAEDSVMDTEKKSVLESGLDKIVDAGEAGVERIIDAGGSGVEKIVDAGEAGVEKIKDAGKNIASKIKEADIKKTGEEVLDKMDEARSVHVTDNALETIDDLLLGKSEKKVEKKPVAKNLPHHLQVRKYRSSLVTSSIAVIAFGIWSIFKAVFQLSTDLKEALADIDISNSMNGMTAEEQDAVKELFNGNTLFVITFALIMFVLVIDLVLRTYVGLSARATGLGKKRKTKRNWKHNFIWLIFACILLAVEVFSLIYAIFDIRSTLEIEGILGAFVLLFAQATSLYAVWDLVSSGFRLRHLYKVMKKKELEELGKEAGHAA